MDLQQLYSHLKDLPAKAFMPIWDGVLPQDLRVYLQGNKIIITYHTYEDDRRCHITAHQGRFRALHLCRDRHAKAGGMSVMLFDGADMQAIHQPLFSQAGGLLTKQGQMIQTYFIDDEGIYADL